ncbi:MAG TPA: hypothetical protein VFT75_18345 [Nocardioidaceae bacterium]|nr:hypothetical protein [Nocardioidaceae bacterium]
MDASSLLVVLVTAFGSAAAVVSFIISAVIPLLTSVVVKQHWPRDVKGIITLFLTALTSFLTQLVESLNDHTRFDWKVVVLTCIGNLVIALGTYFGWWKRGTVQAKLYAFPSRGWARAKPPTRVAA